MNCVQNNRHNSKRVFSSYQNLRQHKILNESKEIPFEWLVCVKEKAHTAVTQTLTCILF